MSKYTDIWLPKTLVVIFIHFNGKEKEFHALKVKKKQKFEDIEKVQQFDSITEIIGEYGENTPYYFSISGSGVLSRKINNTPNFKEELVITGNVEDFIFTSYSDDNHIAVSFFRKELLSELINSNTHLIGISSGSIPLFTLLEQKGTIEFEYKISKENGKILDFTKSEQKKEEATWMNHLYSEKQLLALALFGLIHKKDTNFISSESENCKKREDNYRQFSQFKVYGISVLSFIFFSLLINYFYQNHLNNQIAQLELDLSISNDNLALLDRLGQEKQRKEQLIFNAGVNSSKFISFYLDEIGKTVPSQIKLQELIVFPLTSKLKNKQKIEIDQKMITISGTTIGNEELDDWIETMDRFDWIQGIQLLNYIKNEHGNADFKFQIQLID